MEKIKELLKEVTSEYKWYAVSPDESEQVRLRVTALRILKGEARDDTVQRFFSLFGYNVTFQKTTSVSRID